MLTPDLRKVSGEGLRGGSRSAREAPVDWGYVLGTYTTDTDYSEGVRGSLARTLLSRSRIQASIPRQTTSIAALTLALVASSSSRSPRTTSW